MVPAERQIQPGLYQHEKDQKLISEIMGHPGPGARLRPARLRGGSGNLSHSRL